MQDIHGIRPPVAVGVDPMIMKGLVAALAVILISLLIFFLIRKYLKKRKSGSGPAALPPPLPPFEAAMKALDRLWDHLTDDPRVYYFDLTLILRHYISRTFGIHGAEMTTPEFIRCIQPLDMDAAVQSRVVRFLNHCDPIKYAGVIPAQDGIQTDLAAVKALIEQVEARICQTDQDENKIPKGPGRKEAED